MLALFRPIRFIRVIRVIRGGLAFVGAEALPRQSIPACVRLAPVIQALIIPLLPRSSVA